jgi:hypothetical protein
MAAGPRAVGLPDASGAAGDQHCPVGHRSALDPPSSCSFGAGLDGPGAVASDEGGHVTRVSAVGDAVAGVFDAADSADVPEVATPM